MGTVLTDALILTTLNLKLAAHHFTVLILVFILTAHLALTALTAHLSLTALTAFTLTALTALTALTTLAALLQQRSLQEVGTQHPRGCLLVPKLLHLPIQVGTPAPVAFFQQPRRKLTKEPHQAPCGATDYLVAVLFIPDQVLWMCIMMTVSSLHRVAHHASHMKHTQKQHQPAAGPLS